MDTGPLGRRLESDAVDGDGNPIGAGDAVACVCKAWTPENGTGAGPWWAAVLEILPDGKRAVTVDLVRGEDGAFRADDETRTIRWCEVLRLEPETPAEVSDAAVRAFEEWRRLLT